MSETKPVQNKSPQSATEAKEKENSRLSHSRGGVTTRDDKTDLGVPMLPGSPKERVMPEDALGEGDKRGDYTKRLGDANYRPHEIAKIEDAKAGEAQFEAIPQAPRTEQIGDDSGLKGGVETSPDFNPVK